MKELTDSAIQLLRDRYCTHGEEPKDIFPRIAKEISKHTPGRNGNTKIEKEYLDMMENLDFLPNSPCIRNAGWSNMNKACFVLPVEDSIAGIYRALKQSAEIFKMGGGVGYNFSDLREQGAPLSAGGTSSGVLSFMNMFNASTEAVKQGGFRRGASMGVLDYDHPEIIRFIQEKSKHNRLNNFNVSVLVDNYFMTKVENDDDIYLKSRWDRRRTTSSVKARDIFNLIITYAWDNGDPGLLFFDRINEDNPEHPGKSIRATNPCGEVPLFPYESCCLGSINLSNCVKDNDLDLEKLDYLIEKGTNFLMGMNKSSEFPIRECYDAQNKYFRIGLGVMGYADMLIKMHIKYDSGEAMKIIDKIGKHLQRASKYAHLSVATLSIAPTGSLSIIANCSSSIEPIFAKQYERHVVAGTFKEERKESEYLRTAHEVTPEWHLKTLAKWQKWIDNGVSKTINLPHNSSQRDVYEIYMKAWKMKCKGVTIFRDGCRGDSGQVYRRLTCDGDSCYL